MPALDDNPLTDEDYDLLQSVLEKWEDVGGMNLEMVDGYFMSLICAPQLVNPSDYLPIPNRYYERVRGWGPTQLSGIADTYKFQPITDKVRQVDQHGGYTAGAGHAIYTARTYPAYFWNRTAFVCGPTGHLVGTFLLNGDGACAMPDCSKRWRTQRWGDLTT